jgi:hypothetical protein
MTGQLGLVLLALWRFQIEDTRGLPKLLPLIFFGFAIHCFLPMRYRRAFFLTLSFGGILIVLPFPHSLILIATGLVLIGICHLRIPFKARVFLVGLLGFGLASIRAGWISNPALDKFQQVILPVLGAMFMFRLAIYMHDLRHEKVPVSISERLSYFFLLPNVSFLLFPVVDYQTYRRTYYKGDELGIYQKGLSWMTRGLIHLLLYRFVYQYLVPSQADIVSLGIVAQFAVTSYLLYLRISGQFHLIVGILCMFGFNLPETHHLYYLSSGFNDFWRRINIYWKDFMMKVIYYPVLVGLRKRLKMTTSIVFATVAVFLGTWLLHSYQWFWLRNSFPITAVDGLFWGFLGIMVVINSLKEARAKKKQQTGLTLKTAFMYSAKVVGFFGLMSILWSLWSCSTLKNWLLIISNARKSSVVELTGLAVGIIALILIGVAVQYLLHYRRSRPQDNRQFFILSPALRVAAIASMLIIISLPYIRSSFGSQTEKFITSLRQDRLNKKDRELADRGYYEGLLDQKDFTSPLWAARAQKPGDWEPIWLSDMASQNNDLLWYELKASYTGRFKRAPFTTNRWGMRDKEYDKEKPARTFRIALMGASYEMGGGVNNNQTYEAVLEKLLNAQNLSGKYSQIETLNFAVGGYSLVQNAILAQNTVPQFHPDRVLLTVYSTESARLTNNISNVMARNRLIPYPDLQAIIDRARVKPGMDAAQISERLQPFVYDIIEWSFRKIKADCERGEIPLIVVFMPTTTDDTDRSAAENVKKIWDRAVRARLEPTRMENIFLEDEIFKVQLNRWDSHPSVYGHQLIARKLCEFIVQHEPQLFEKTQRAKTAGLP